MYVPLSIPSARYTDKADLRESPPRCETRAGKEKHVTETNEASVSRESTRVKPDDHGFVDVASDVSTIRCLLEGTNQLGGVDFDPLRQALTRCQVERFLDACLALGLFTHGNDVAGLQDHGSDVSRAAAHFDGAVVHQLTRFGAGRAEAHAVHHVVETRLEQLNQRFAGVATTAVGFSQVLAELLVAHTVDGLELLLYAQLQAEVGSTRTRGTAVLSGLGFDLALRVERAAGALQKQVGTLATRELALRSNITCQDASP